MGVEIERKFLVDVEKWHQFDKPEPTYLKQGYIVNEAHKSIRVRIAGEQASLTLKGATSGITRNEYEYPVPVKDAVELLNNFAVSWIEKERYCINFAGYLWEVDQFLGDNTGLITAEIELEHEAEEFELPTWVTKEVSTDKRYYNSCLSLRPFNKW
jgi:adenylate cyclase